MYDWQEYCWMLVEEAARESECRLPFDERCSAAALGLAYGIQTYTSADGEEILYLKACMKEAIEETKKKQSSCKKIESDYSLNKEYYTDNGSVTGHDFIPHPAKSPEHWVLFRDFFAHLNFLEAKAAYELMHGSSKLEFMDPHKDHFSLYGTYFGISSD